MSARPVDSEAYSSVDALAREIRELVADQLHDLVVESQRVASQEELVEGVRRVGSVGQRIVEARGRQLQAAEMGLPVRAHVKAEADGLELLRASVMSLAAVCADWVVAMDFKERRPQVESSP